MDERIHLCQGCLCFETCVLNGFWLIIKFSLVTKLWVCPFLYLSYLVMAVRILGIDSDFGDFRKIALSTLI